MDTRDVNTSRDQARTGHPEFLERVRQRAGEPIRLRFSFELDVRMPIEIFVGYPQNYGFIGPGTLPISEALERDLVDHLHWWQENIDPYGDDEEDEVAFEDESDEVKAWFTEQGRLRERLQAELGTGFAVEQG